MELFKLFGTIAIKNAEANKAIDETNQKGEETQEKFKKIRETFKETFKDNTSTEKASKNLKDLTETVEKQEKELTSLKDKYKDLYLTQGKNSDEAKNCAVEIKKLSEELSQNKEKLKEAEDAAEKYGKELDDTANNASQVKDKIGNAFSKIGSFAVKAGKTVAVGLAAGATAMTALTTQALNLGGELEQNIGGSEAVFQQYAGSMQDTANDAFKNMGLSASDFLATANKMGSLFQGAGFGIEESAKLSEDAMQRAADVASIMGIDTASAMEAVAGAAKGNFTMMDNLGVAMNETTLANYALEKGMEKTYDQMTQQEKIGLAMEMFMEKTSYAAGNYAKENETLAGSLSTAKAALTNFLSGSGDVDDVVESFSSLANVVVDNLDEIIPRLVTGVTDLVNQLVPLIPPLLEKLLPGIIEGAVSLINGLVSALPAVIDALMQMLPGIIEGIASIINTLIDKLPEMIDSLVKALPGLLPVILEAIVSVILALVNNFSQIIQPIIDYLPEIIINLVNALMENLPALIEGLVTLVMGIVEAVPQIISALMEALPTIISDIVTALLDCLPQLIQAGVQLFVAISTAIPQAIPEIVKAIPEIVTSIIDALMETDWLQVGMDILTGIGEGLIEGAGSIGSWIVDAGQTIKDGFCDFFDIHSPSRLFASLIGVNLAKGIGVGFEDEMPSVNNAMTKSVTTDFESSVNILGNYRKANVLDDFKNTDIVSPGANSDVSTKLDKIISLLSVFFPQLLEAFNVELVFDGDRIVTKIVPKINQKLAEETLLNERGLAHA